MYALMTPYERFLFCLSLKRVDGGKIKRVCMESSKHKSANISPPNCNRMLIFLASGHFFHALSKYLIKSRNVTNSSICDVTLWNSIFFNNTDRRLFLDNLF